MSSGLSCRLESQDAAGALHGTRKVLVLYRSGRPFITPLTDNEPYAADILQALKPAKLTLRQVRVHKAFKIQTD